MLVHLKTEIKQDPQGCDSLKKRNLVDEKTLCFVVGGFAMGTTVALGDLPVHVLPMSSSSTAGPSYVASPPSPGDHCVQGVELNEADLGVERLRGHQHLGRLSQRLHLCKPCLSFANPSVEEKERAAH